MHTNNTTGIYNVEVDKLPNSPFRGLAVSEDGNAGAKNITSAIGKFGPFKLDKGLVVESKTFEDKPGTVDNKNKALYTNQIPEWAALRLATEQKYGQFRRVSTAGRGT